MKGRSYIHQASKSIAPPNERGRTIVLKTIATGITEQTEAGDKPGARPANAHYR